VLLGPLASAAQADYPSTILTDHPISYWRLNDTSGTTALDQKGNDNGTIQGGVTLGQPGPFPGSGAMSFDGGNCSGVSLDANASSLQPPTVSVEAWVKTTQVGDNVVFRMRTNGYELHAADGSAASAPLFGAYASAGNAYARAASSIADGRWHYLVGTEDGTNITLYVDGNLAGSSPWPGGGISYGGTQAAIGRDADACSGVLPSFQGDISEVAVYNYALSAAQVAAHYAAAPSLGGDPLTAQTGSVTNNKIVYQPGWDPNGWGDATLNGTVTPGNGQTSWWFEVNQVGSTFVYYVPGTYNCPGVPYTCTSAPTPQPYSSPSVPAEIRADSFQLTPWHLYQ
jgi:Concanavalin A-like lectin/glucanases superfamily